MYKWKNRKGINGEAGKNRKWKNITIEQWKSEKRKIEKNGKYEH